MLLDAVQRALVTYPTAIYLGVSSTLAVFALRTFPSFVPMVLLLAILRLFVTVVIVPERAWFKSILAIACLAASTTIANIGPSLSAIPEVHTSTAIFSLFFLTCITSTLMFCAVYIDATFHSGAKDTCTRFTIFPAIWSTALLIASIISPLGYLATWSPVLGVRSYSWLRPILGPTGIDWVVGAWAVVMSELSACIVEPRNQLDEQEEHHLIFIVSEDDTEESERPRNSLWLFCIAAILCIGTLPSYFHRPLPLPANSDYTTPLPVACAFPFIENSRRLPSFEEYLHETQMLIPLAKVILWPEGAVRFKTVQEKQESIEKVARFAAGSVIGVSFEDYMNSTERCDKIRNGFMLIDKDGVVFEYFKRNLIPFIESNLMVSHSAPPVLFDYQQVTKRNSRGKATDYLSVPITASICLDFAQPAPFSSLTRRPSLILAPGHTWHPNIGAAMWVQAQARAEEVGGAVLWCDGGDHGIGGVGGRGLGSGEIMQVGPGSWVRTIGLETVLDDRRTVYGIFGPWFSLALIWSVFGIEKLVGWLLRMQCERGQEVDNGSDLGLEFGMRLPRVAIDRLTAWRGRQMDNHGEHTHLI